MYVKDKIPYKNYKQEPKNGRITLNLDEREVFKLLVQFKRMMDWIEGLDQSRVMELPTEEVVAFYDDLETVLLASWGEMSADGEHFRKSGRYEFEESALFNAVMLMFVTDTVEAQKMINDLLPKGMEERVKTAQDNLENSSVPDPEKEAMKAELERLRASNPAAPSNN